jgi:hypothetical protein
LSFYHEYFLGFESKFWPAPSWNITRQVPDFPENFAFAHGRVLFVGLNLVGGIIQDQQEWNTRHAACLEWVNETVAANEGTFDVLLVTAHADPDIDVNAGFFTPFFAAVQQYEEKVIYVHRNLGTDAWQLEPEFNAISNLDVVVVEGSLWPPMWIQIDTQTSTVSIDQISWYEDYSTTGVMPVAPPQ